MSRYTPVTVSAPVDIPAGILRAVRNHPTTSIEDSDEMNTRIGWLVCAWDVIVEEIKRAGSAAADTTTPPKE